MLKEYDSSPPVPTMSMTSAAPVSMNWPLRLRKRAAPVSSSTVSPLARKAMRKAAICSALSVLEASLERISSISSALKFSFARALFISLFSIIYFSLLIISKKFFSWRLPVVVRIDSG